METKLEHGSCRPKAKLLRLPGTIAQEVGKAIVSGGIMPGMLMDGEVAASKIFGVSRTVYREAIRILSAKGLVEAKPKTGTRVSELTRWQLLDPDVLSWIFSGDPEPGLIANLFELRRIIEPAAAALAAERRNFRELGEMEDALVRMERFTLSSEQGRLADSEFHSILLAASRNPFLASLTEGICAAVGLATIFRLQRASPKRDPLPDHRKVFEAIAAQRAVDANAHMVALIDHTYLDTQQVAALRADRIAK